MPYIKKLFAGTTTKTTISVKFDTSQIFLLTDIKSHMEKVLMILSKFSLFTRYCKPPKI